MNGCVVRPFRVDRVPTRYYLNEGVPWVSNLVSTAPVTLLVCRMAAWAARRTLSAI